VEKVGAKEVDPAPVENLGFIEWQGLSRRTHTEGDFTMESQRMETRGVFSWQKKLLPLMIGMLAVLAFFFFVASFIQLYYLHTRIEDAPKLDLAQAFSIPDSGGAATDIGKLDYSKWKALSILEGYSLQRRYHQANVLLMSRVWTRYLGFVTGMILAFVGAAFILGKLREPETKLDSEGIWKFSLTTASPGLILAVCVLLNWIFY